MQGARIFLIAVALILLTAAWAGADPMGDTNSDLYYKLDSQAVFLPGATSTNDTIADLVFSIKYSSSLTVNNIKAKISYNRDSLKLVDITGDPAILAAFPTRVVDTLTEPGKIYLRYSGGTFDLASTYQAIATLRFKLKVMPDSSSTLVPFVSTATDSNEVVTTLGEEYTPTSGNFIPGKLYNRHYYLYTDIRDTTIAAATGIKVPMRVNLTSNHLLYYVTNNVRWDPTKVGLDSVSSPLSSAYYFQVNFVSDSEAHVVLINLNVRIPEMDNEELYTLWFEPICQPTVYTDWSTAFSFNVEECFMPSWAGGEIIDSTREEGFPGGILTVNDDATVQASLVGATNPMIHKGTEYQTIPYKLELASTFAPGASPTDSADSGIVVNFNFGSANLGFHPSTPFVGSNACWERDGEPGNTGYIKQCFDPDGNWDPSATTDSILTLNLLWSNSGYSPSWNSQLITPTIINATNNNQHITRVTDANSCRELRQGVGALTLGTMEPIEVAQGNLYISGSSFTTPCGWVDLYLRANTTIRKFKVRITLNSNTMFCSFTQFRTGAFRNCDSTGYLIETNGDWTPIDSNEIGVKVCRINIGIKSGYCPAMGKPTSIGVGLSNAIAWSSTDQSYEEYMTASGGSSSARCPNGTPCGCISVPCADEGGLLAKEELGQLPREFSLEQNYPNPFNPVTTISMYLPHASDWNITIFNITGQVVKEFSGYDESGEVRVEWDASHCASGVYLYRATAGEHAATRKMILMK